MAEPRTPHERLNVETSPENTVGFGQDVMDSIQALSRPMEMTDLSTSRPIDVSPAREPDSSTSEEKERDGIRSGKAESKSAEESNHSIIAETTSDALAESAIQPATDKPARIRSASSVGPQLVIILLLHSTQTRHPYIINEKYLKKRNIGVADGDPTNMSVYTLKELIWRDWREGQMACDHTEEISKTNLSCRMGSAARQSYFYSSDSHGSHVG